MGVEAVSGSHGFNHQSSFLPPPLIAGRTHRARRFAQFSSNPFEQPATGSRAAVDLEDDPTGSGRVDNALAGFADKDTLNGAPNGQTVDYLHALYKPVINGVRAADATFASPNDLHPGRISALSSEAAGASAHGQAQLGAALLSTTNGWQGLYEMPSDIASLGHLCEPFDGFDVEAGSDKPSPDTSSDQPPDPPLLLGAGSDL